MIQPHQRGGQTGKGQLYYTAHLKTYLPVEKVAPLNRGVIISRDYRLADCGLPQDDRTIANNATGHARRSPRPRSAT